MAPKGQDREPPDPAGNVRRVSIDPVWAGTIGALGGVAVTGVFSLVTAKVTHSWQRTDQKETRKHERRTAIVELRRTSYAQYLVAAQRLRDTTRGWVNAVGQHIEDDNERYFKYGEDLRQDIDAYEAAERQAVLLADATVEAELGSFFRVLAKAMRDLIYEGKSFGRVFEEPEERLTRAMKAELRDLTESA